MNVPRRRILFPLAAVAGLALGALASSCGHQPRLPFSQGAEYGARLAQRIDNPSPPKVHDRPPPDWVWTAWLPDFLPAVTACLRAAAEPEAVATQAWPVRAGFIGVHLKATDGRRWDCVASAQGMTVERLDLLPDGSPPEGPVFARLGQEGEAPPAGCGPAKPATNGAGRQIGWVMPGPC